MFFIMCFCLFGGVILAGYILWSIGALSYNKTPIKKIFNAGGRYSFNENDGYSFQISTKPLTVRKMISKLWIADARYVSRVKGDTIRVRYGRRCWGDFLIKEVYILPAEPGEKRGFYYQKSGISLSLGPIRINPSRPVLFMPSMACHDKSEVTTIERIMERSVKKLPELMSEKK